MRPRSFPRLPVLILAVSLCSLRASAQENMELGRMWTFENPPLAYLEKEYGFKPDQAWLNNLRLAALRLGDKNRGWCSASFVSPKGLIMSNHHCVRDAMGATRAANAGGSKWVAEGFYATSLEDEVRLKSESGDDVWVTQLVGMSDITKRINDGIVDGDNEAATKKQRDANKEKVLAEHKKAEPNKKFQVVALYQGAIFQLYEYKTYTDVRLVCVPHLQTAHFGGDPDNFTYPRYSIDFSFCRAYEDGEPANTSKHYFKWKMGGAKQGDLVFIPGNPGSTQRLQTKAQMEYDRDAKNPILKELIDNRLEIYRTVAKRYPEVPASLSNTILGLENYQKALGGEQRGLLDNKLMAQKAAAEKAFRARVNRDPELRKKYGHVWDGLQDIAKKKTDLEAKKEFYTAAYSEVMNAAMQLVQAFDPELEEKKREAIKKAAERRLRQPIRGGGGVLFADHMQRAKKWLPKDDPYLADVWGGRSGRRNFNRLRRSRVSRTDFREELFEGGWEAIQESEDFAIVVARKLVPIRRQVQEKVAALAAQEESLGVLIGRALFACYGTKVSPDATMTLRFSDGVVKGYPYNGTIAPYRTTFYGLFGRNIDFGNKHPFDLPEVWLENRSKIDLTKSVNFVSTNDITGGNSGSVVVSKDLRVVGLVFDGNIESLPNNYVFRDDIPRSVSVHVDAIMEAMKKVYEAKRVVAELTGE